MDIVFYRPGLGSVSPAISVAWEKPVVDLLNRILPMGSSVNLGAYAEEACADFVVALSADPVTAELTPRVEVLNLRLRWDRIDALYPETAAGIPAWREALFAEIARAWSGVKDPQWLPVLVDLEPPFAVTRGSELLCRMVNVLSEPWKEGQPLWVVPPKARKAGRTRRRT
jgi:hypothetical protein